MGRMSEVAGTADGGNERDVGAGAAGVAAPVGWLRAALPRVGQRVATHPDALHGRRCRAQGGALVAAFRRDAPVRGDGRPGNDRASPRPRKAVNDAGVRQVVGPALARNHRTVVVVGRIQRRCHPVAPVIAI